MRFGLNGATTGKADLLLDIRVAAAAGYQYLEIRDVKLESYLQRGGTIEALARTFEDAGVRPLSVNALERSTLGTPETRKTVLDRLRRFCEWAEGLDCPYVVAVPSPLEAPMPREEVVTQSMKALQQIAEVAKEYGVKVGFEFLGFASCSVNTLELAAEIVDRVGDPSLGLVIDTFHFYVGGSSWSALETLDPQRIFIVHLDDAEDLPCHTLTDANRVLPGDGVIPLRDLVGRLEARGYRGPYSIELFRPEYWEWDPLDLAVKARERMEQLLPISL
ncbi:MAG: sugar phosphate isomerase/epimerase family protein [Armatimonadota bacterium]|nr:sugar phosphate isomerase/epimerase family protein [Armatimonadota bacterium]MDR5702603.1 sugar phosphate isomerase/epimerase family protein [Armatimonadota bacterium]